jgi:hypothetical protein
MHRRSGRRAGAGDSAGDAPAVGSPMIDFELQTGKVLFSKVSASHGDRAATADVLKQIAEVGIQHQRLP